jgi:hypothetical protein
MVTVRLPHEMLAALKLAAEERVMPYQRLMKEMLAEALGLASSSKATTTSRYPAPHLSASMRKLNKSKRR